MSTLSDTKEWNTMEILEKIKAAGIENYGVNRWNLYEHLSPFAEAADDGVTVIAALDNADTDQQLLKVLESDCEKVLEGMTAIGRLLGTETLKLILPEKQSGLTAEIGQTAEKYGIEVIAEFVDVRANKDNVILHMLTMLDIFDLLHDKYQPGVYLVLDGQIKKLSSDTKIKDVLDVSDAKALLLGYRLHRPEDAELTLEDANTENGLIQVLGQKDCIVTETEKRLLESRQQSCGKCVFCREGLIQLHHMQKEIVAGRGKKEYTDLNKEIGEAMKISTLCSMGQVSAEISLTAMENFQAEYDSHVKKKICPAGVCTSFTNIYIDPQKCIGCEECADICPADCIEGKAKYIHMIDDFDCTKCGKCIAVCEQGAIQQTTGKIPKLPNRLTKVGRFKRR